MRQDSANQLAAWRAETVNTEKKPPARVEPESFNTLRTCVDSLLSHGLALRDIVRLAQKFGIEASMARHNGNQSKAAVDLGMHRNTLARQRKLSA